MSTPFRCVIDKGNIFVTNVVMTDPQTGEWLEKPYYYTLGEGEQLVKAPCPPGSIVRAKWAGSDWVEAATEAEIEGARIQREAEDARRPREEERDCPLEN